MTGIDPLAKGTLPELERYVVFDRLATGGMASIYLAQRRGEDRVCIIKVLHDHLAKDPVVGNRFLREAQVASLLDHPHIARLTDAGWDHGQFYLAMEFIGGQDLETMMFKLMEQRRMLPPELSATVGQQVLAGLEYAHNYRDSEGQHLQIVHRDLSPRNVMITYSGEVKIIDFGLARTNLGDFRTAPGMVLGTLRYMSPEQAVAEPVDRRSDLYSWAVVLYEALSGRPLVMGANAQEILHQVVTQVPVPISERNPSLPAALDPVFAKALQKSREDRYPSARALKVALAEAAPELFAASDAIGDFVSTMYAEEKRKSEEMLSQAQAGEYTQEPTRVGDSPEFQATRAGVPTPLATDGTYEPTRLGPPAPRPGRAASTLLLDPALVPEAHTPTRIQPDPAASWGSVNVRPVRRGPSTAAVVGATAAILMSMVAFGYGYFSQPDQAPTVPFVEAAAAVEPTSADGPIAESTGPGVAARPPPTAAPPETVANPPVPENPSRAKRTPRPGPNRPSEAGSAPPSPVHSTRPTAPEEGPPEKVTRKTVEACANRLTDPTQKRVSANCISSQQAFLENWQTCYDQCIGFLRSQR